MYKVYLAFFTLLCLSLTLSAQKKEKHFRASLYDLTSKKFTGPITDLTDSTISTLTNRKVMIWRYSSLKMIKVHEANDAPIMMIGSFIGIGKAFSSIYRESFIEGLKTAGIGFAIVFAGAGLDEVFKKRYEKINLPTDINLKNRLEKYVRPKFKPDTIRVQ